MKVPLLDLTPQYEQIREEVDAALMHVVRSQQFILGPRVEEFERELAAYCGTRFAVGLSSGTDALIAALMAIGLQPGDEVITTPFTFFATAGCIARVGGVPVFADIDPDTFNIDPALIEERITSRTRAIVPVHLYGQCADMDPIVEIAERHGLKVIEDAAQAIGAEDKGRRAGSMGDIGCFSFFPSKNLAAFGDAGAVTTDDDGLYDLLKALRMHGETERYRHRIIGGNFRLDALQAAVLSVKLKYLDGWSDKRARNAQTYRGLFKESGIAADSAAGQDSARIVLPPAQRSRHIFNQFVIRAQQRDDLMEFLDARDVAARVYYPIPLHVQECFAYLGYKRGDFPKSEAAALSVLALPIYPDVTAEQQEYVVSSIEAFYGTYA